MSETIKTFLAPLLVGLGVVVLTLVGGYWTIYNDGYDDGFVQGEEHEQALLELAVRSEEHFLGEATQLCVNACTLRGYPSLNAFYVANRAECMCQHPHPTDDIHGFFFLQWDNP